MPKNLENKGANGGKMSKPEEKGVIRPSHGADDKISRSGSGSPFPSYGHPGVMRPSPEGDHASGS